MKLAHVQLRETFNKFWARLDHKNVAPISLVPKEDPSTLFTGSGMQPLIPYLLGEPHPLGKKLYNIQPCFRSQDIARVGDNRHTTFFEMMGNWSLGTYFKKEQIPWMWNFFTHQLGLAKEKLFISVFEGYKDIAGDAESLTVWKKLGIQKDHLFAYGVDKNWWSRSGVPEAMPAGEPGGPDTEIFYQFDHIKHDKRFGDKCHPNCECGRFLEIGNCVFMQYKKNADGTFSDLPNKNVDFGGGLERILAAVVDTPDVFAIDVFSEIIKSIEAYTGQSYLKGANQSAIRIIADHLKAATFLIHNRVYPSNKQQGYILRRLLRRAAVKFNKLTGAVGTFSGLDFKIILESIIDTYKGVYFETADLKKIIPVVVEEMDRFGKTVRNGLREIEKLNKIDGKIAFDFYQSYGFPLEITEELLRDKGQTINRAQFYSEFDKHKNLSRTASAGKFKGGLANQSKQTIRYHTATHLIHQALFDVFGNVRQEGSNITAERLRFDFYCEQKVTQEDISKVEQIVNAKIKEGMPVNFKMLSKEEAIKIGARAFFKEKYADQVKVYFIGDYSKELCGGPHVQNTKEVGTVTIYKFEKIGSNLYRLYAK